MNNYDFTSTLTTNNRNRTKLTNVIVISGFILLGLLSIVIIFIAYKTDEKLESAKWVFNAVVPLVASWVGAVIAFYFGRDNYEAATEQVLALTRETLDDIYVENIMINIKTIVAQKIDPNDDDKTKLDELIDLYQKIDKDRIPVFSKSLNPRFIIHRSTMMKYRQDHNVDSENELTLKNIIDDNQNYFGYNKEKGFVIVTKDTTLNKTLAEMKKVEDCQDVFVTDNGKESGVVLGWLTNSLINRFLSVSE